jgi:hypothetical protein
VTLKKSSFILQFSNAGVGVFFGRSPLGVSPKRQPKLNNIDGLQHAVGYGIGDFLLLGKEDLYGDLWAKGQDAKTGKWNENSDRDFNDVVVAVKLGEKNISRLVKESNSVKSASTPEPTAALPMVVIGAFGLMGLRRRKAAAIALQ